MEQQVDVKQILETSEKLRKLVKVLEEINSWSDQMMRTAQSDGAFDSKCAVAFGVAIMALDAARNIMSRDPRLAAVFKMQDRAIFIANVTLTHFHKAPMVTKSDLMDALPAEMKIATKAADYTKTTLGGSGLAGAPKAIPTVLKAITKVQNKVPGIKYILNTPALKSHLSNYQQQLKPHFKKIPGNLGFVVDTVTDVLQDGALVLAAYDGYQRNKADGGAALRRSSEHMHTQRRRLIEMDQKIMYMVDHVAPYRAGLA